MSKSHCLPLGAPMQRIDYATMRLQEGYDENYGDETGDEDQDGGDDDDDDDDDSFTRMSRANLAPGVVFNLGKLGTKRKRGKDAKPVDQLDLKTGKLLRRYASQTETCTTMRVSSIYISECCRNMRSDAYGFRWRFIEDCPEDEKDFKPSDEWTPHHELMAIRERNKNNFGFKYIKLDDGTYVDPRKLARSGDGEQEDFDEDEFDMTRRKSRAIPVEQCDLETGKVLRRYASQNEAATAMKTTQVGISQCCRGARKEFIGFSWKWSEVDEDTVEEAIYVPIAKLLSMKKQYENQVNLINLKVVEQFTLDTGVIVRRYANVAAAANSVGAALRNLQKVLQGVIPSAYGYGWRCYEGPPLDREYPSLSICLFKRVVSADVLLVEEDNKQADREHLRIIMLNIRNFKKAAAAEMKRDSLVANEDFDDMDIEEIDELADIEEIDEPLPPVPVNKPRSPGSSYVEQVDLLTGQVLKTHKDQAAAAAAVNGLETFISKCLVGVVDEAYGYAWRYCNAPAEEA